MFRDVKELVGMGCCDTGITEQLDRATAEELAHLFKAVADPTRLQLLAMIKSSPNSEACVCDLTAPLDLSQPTISHHLRVLTEAGLVTRSSRGTWAWYSINEVRLRELSAVLS